MTIQFDQFKAESEASRSSYDEKITVLNGEKDALSAEKNESVGLAVDHWVMISQYWKYVSYFD